MRCELPHFPMNRAVLAAMVRIFTLANSTHSKLTEQQSASIEELTKSSQSLGLESSKVCTVPEGKGVRGRHDCSCRIRSCSVLGCRESFRTLILPPSETEERIADHTKHTLATARRRLVSRVACPNTYHYQKEHLNLRTVQLHIGLRTGYNLSQACGGCAKVHQSCLPHVKLPSPNQHHDVHWFVQFACISDLPLSCRNF